MLQGDIRVHPINRVTNCMMCRTGPRLYKLCQNPHSLILVFIYLLTSRVHGSLVFSNTPTLQIIIVVMGVKQKHTVNASGHYASVRRSLSLHVSYVTPFAQRGAQAILGGKLDVRRKRVVLISFSLIKGCFLSKCSLFMG